MYRYNIGIYTIHSDQNLIFYFENLKSIYPDVTIENFIGLSEIFYVVSIPYELDIIELLKIDQQLYWDLYDIPCHLSDISDINPSDNLNCCDTITTEYLYQ
jgi:hypothetical protein